MTALVHYYDRATVMQLGGTIATTIAECTHLVVDDKVEHLTTSCFPLIDSAETNV